MSSKESNSKNLDSQCKKKIPSPSPSTIVPTTMGGPPRQAVVIDPMAILYVDLVQELGTTSENEEDNYDEWKGDVLLELKNVNIYK